MALTFWQARRNRLNHDRLKNRLLTGLRKYLNVLRGEVIDVGFEETFPVRFRREWDEACAEIGSLLDDFREAESPKRLFCEVPLRRLDAESRLWLADLLDHLWIQSIHLTVLEASARAALMNAGRCQSIAASAWDAGEARSAILERVEALARAIQDVSRCISEYPGPRVIEQLCRSDYPEY